MGRKKKKKNHKTRTGQVGLVLVTQGRWLCADSPGRDLSRLHGELLRLAFVLFSNVGAKTRIPKWKILK